MKTIFICLSFFFTGCASVQPAPELSFRKFSSAADARALDMQRLRGTALLRYETAGRAIQGKASFVTAREGMRLEVRDPMGTLRYYLAGKEKNAQAYYQDENIVYEDSQEGAAYFRRFFGFALTVQEFRALLLGSLPLHWKALPETWERVSSTGGYRYEAKSITGPLKISVTATGMLERIEMNSRGGNLLVEYSDFDACCSYQGQQAQLAHVVRVVLPKPGEQIEIEWSHLDVIQGTSNPRWFALDAPRGSKVVQLK